ncbi:AbrB/MazE/SpoVT family DNA-binding domain-containing protein [bacterium]|nr:AbrB/MazE/SpoVT family DNA-binding domain-containing protein [bacterium]
MASNTTFTLKVEQNEMTGEYYILLPEKLLNKIKWKAGDHIKWSLNKDGSFTLKKV